MYVYYILYKMALKNIELAKAEDFSKTFRDENGLPNSGMIIIATKNQDLRTEFITMPEGGIREYLLSLGNFIGSELEEN